MLRWSTFLLLGAVALVGLALAPPPLATTVQATTADGHTLTIEYLSSRGAYRAARVSVRSERGAATPWSGDLLAVHLEGRQPLSPRDRDRLAREGFRVGAETPRADPSRGIRMVAPEPGNLLRIWLLGERGAVSVGIPPREGTPSTQGDEDNDDGKEDPDDPDPGGDPDPGEGSGGDDDEEESWCSIGASQDCPGIYNPWTCVCTSSAEDREWWNSRFTDGSTMQISF